MTTPTKEQADAALNSISKMTKDWAHWPEYLTLRARLAHLEANQRHAVPDEKLRGAVMYLRVNAGDCLVQTADDEDMPSIEITMSEDMDGAIDDIEAALPELAECRAKQQWLPIETAPMDGRKLLLGVYKDGEWYEVLGRYNLKGVNAKYFTLVPVGFGVFERPAYFKFLPTPPAEGGA